MRMQSPASQGLLPASYSRRRRNRPNESLVSGGGGVNSNNSNSNNNNGGGNANAYYDPEATAYADSGAVTRTGVSPRRTNSSRKPLYTLASKSSDDENDENDRHRHNMSSSSTDAYEQGYEDVLDKPAKLSDFLINDRCYQRYVSEGKRLSYRGIGGKNRTVSNEKGFMDPAFLAKLSAGASFVGMIFLIFVAILMETQPLFIKGVSAKSTVGEDGTYRFRKETSNALKAAAAYFLTMVFSIIYLQTKDMNLELNPAMGRICHLRRMIVTTYFRYRRRHYADIPDSFSGATSAGSGSILPIHSGSANGGDDKLKKRRKRRSSRRSKDGSDGSGLEGAGSAMEGVMGKLKSWGIGKGSSRSGRKKDR